MSDLSLLPIGAGGIAVVLLTRELIRGIFLRKSNGNGNLNRTGDKPVEFWQLELRRSMSESLEVIIIPALENQTKVLEKMLEVQNEMKNSLIRQENQDGRYGSNRH